MASTLVNLVQAQIDASQQVFDAKTLTRPTLLLSDGSNLTYCVDLDVGQLNPLKDVPIASGAKEVFYASVGSAVKVQRSASGWFEVTGLSKRMPGTYIQVAVTLERFNFAPQTIYGSTPPPPPASGTIVIGTPVEVGLSSRPLTLGELADYGGFGIVPFGAIAIFRGTTFIELA